VTDNLRHAAAHAEAAWKGEVDDLKREGRGIPSRFGDRSTEPNAVIAINQPGHGWDEQTVIRNVSGTWEAAIDDGADAGDHLYVVTRVQDADNVLAIAWGLFCADGLADHTAYYLSASTPGALTTTRPTGADVAGRMVLYHITNDLVIVPGPILGRTHRHEVADLTDVDLVALADGDALLYDSASETWQNGPITAGSLAPIAGLSVLGRSANTTGVVAPITAATTGHVLQMGASSLSWGQLSTASYSDGSVTNVKLDDVVGAAGPIGSSSAVSVVTINAKGRVTALTTATITPAAIGASATGHTHTLASLTDVSVTSPANGEYLRYNGSAWAQYSLGDLAYDPGSKPYHDRLVLVATDLGIRSRLLINSTGSLEFIVRGVEPTNDKWAKVAVDGSDVAFTDDTHETLRWVCSATAGSRAFRFAVPVQVTDTGTKNLVFTGTATQTWTMGDDVGPSIFATMLGTAADAYGRRVKLGCDLDLGGGGWVVYADRSGGTLSSRLWVGTTDGTWAQDGTITITGPTLVRLTGGNTAATYGRLDLSTTGVSLFCSASGTQTGAIGCSSAGIQLTTSGTNPVAIIGPVTMNTDLTVASTRLVVTSTNVSIGLPIVQDASVPTFTMKQSGTTFGLWDTGKIVIGGSAAGATKAVLSTSNLNDRRESRWSVRADPPSPRRRAAGPSTPRLAPPSMT
jgi:hypothetical protein